MEAYAKTGRFQGSVLVAEKGEVIYQKGFGYANAELKVPNAPETKFRLGSITKQFTALLMMQLAAEGKVKLDGRLSDYVPEYPKATAERITIHQLLTHQSGIPNYTTPEFFAKRSREYYSPIDLAKVFWDRPLDFEPGAKFSYSNSGYHVLGIVIEKLTGKTYEQALRERVLDPLGMRDTGYDHSVAILLNRAAGYAKAPGGLSNAAYIDMSSPYSAGALYSTVLDLRKWDAALYTEKLVSAKYRDLMFQPAVKSERLGGASYGYGWIIAIRTLPESKRQVRVVEHGGGINGFTSQIVRMPDDGHLIVMLSNQTGTNWSGARTGIGQILYGERAEIPKRSLADALGRSIGERGIEAAIAEARALKEKQANEYEASEEEMNALGYARLREKKTDEAIAVLKLNAEWFPKSWNVYDSLGEAYATAGKRELALESYRKALELNPKAESAMKAVKELEEARKLVSP